ncbi:MAG: NUDIX hydrolase [Candidatus Baltobacteraceae bacterium]
MNALDSKRIWQGRIVNVRVDEIDGVRGLGRRTIEVVEHPGGVAVIARPSLREIVLVRQYRHPVGQELWEVPAGKIERGEPPLETAQRELVEETGYRAERLRFLWSMYSTPGFCSERIHFFAAEGLTAGEAQPEDDEQFEIRVWSIEEAWRLVEADRLRDSKTQIALAWARLQQR